MVNLSTRSLAAFEHAEDGLTGRVNAAIGAIRSRISIGGLKDKRAALVTAETGLACVNQRCVSAIMSARRSFCCGGGIWVFSQLDGNTLSRV